jgi:hypothetical protein
MPRPKPTPTKQQPLESEEEYDADDEPKDRGSLADRFNAIAKSFSSNASDVPPGMYEAIIKEAVLQAPDAKGQSVRIKFELCDPEFKGQNQITNWFRVINEEGEPVQGAIHSLAYNFAKLGYDLDWNELENTLAEITEEKPGIIAKVTVSQGTQRVFTNVSIEKTCDNDVVQEYKDNIPY